MLEHLIRLRGGWLWHVPHAPEQGAKTGQRVTLPLDWPAGLAGRVRLVRSFGPPPLDRACETLTLRLEQVGGLTSIALNGNEIARPPVGITELDVPLPDPLPGRNVLVLDVDVAAGPHGPDRDRGLWGAIALVIKPRGSASPPRVGSDATDRPGAGDRGEEELLGGTEPPA